MLFSPPLVVPADQDKKYRSAQSLKPVPLPSIHEESPVVDLTVVIPAYNETERMPAMLKSTIFHLKSDACSAKTHEILIVDDGSSDDTSDLALQFSKENPKEDIRVVTLHKNLGKGGAVRHGMLHGRGRRLLMVDADGASRFEDLELLWKAMDELESESNPAAIAVGSRAHLVKSEAVVKVRFGLLICDSTVDFVFDLAFPPPQHPHVRLTHHPTHRRRWSYSGYSMWLQAFFTPRGPAHIPVSAPLHVDIRRRGALAGKTATCPCRGSAHRVA